MVSNNLPPQPERRGFLKGALALLIGGVTGLFPMLAGLPVLLDPLRRKSKAGEAIQVAPLSALAINGPPQKFSVITTQIDAWNKLPHVPIGAVYLRRISETKVQAFNVTCPHAGCFVDYSSERKSYLCPCHNSAFGMDGRVTDPKSPSPRGMDELEVEIRNGTEIWVKFQNFRAGEEKKIPA